MAGLALLACLLDYTCPPPPPPPPAPAAAAASESNGARSQPFPDGAGDPFNMMAAMMGAQQGHRDINNFNSLMPVNCGNPIDYKSMYCDVKLD